MIKNATISIFAPSTTRDGQGAVIKTWDNYATPVAGPLLCDVQPANLSEYQAEEWGISDLKSNAKKVFLDFSLKSIWQYFKVGNRVVVAGDQTYDIRGTNPWSRSLQGIMTPVQGGP